MPPKADDVTKDGMTKVWWDDFDDYTGAPDPDLWTYQTGKSGWGNNELQNYTDNSENPNEAFVGNGYLTIRAHHDGTEWKSARLNSKQAWKYGYIEARMKITDTKGCWPAFWMMPRDSIYGGWPASGEIDIMENAPATCGNHTLFSSLHAQGHYSGNPASIGKKNFGSNLKNEWHTVAVKWTENKIWAIYDGEVMGSYTNNGRWEDWPYDKEFYIILNLAIGGNLGGTGYVNSIPNKEALFLIDYVRVYQ
jgi:beta-glucanase (GH16 family)